jgi:hypothetical protein
VTATTAGGTGPSETAPLAEGRSTYPDLLFSIQTTFTIAPRTPAQARPDEASFVAYLVEQHNIQEPAPQFRLQRSGIRTTDCWRFGLPLDPRFDRPTPLLGFPGECFLLFIILTIPGDGINKAS